MSDVDDLIEVGRDLYASGLITSHGGNASVRRDGGGALITATGAMLGRLTPSLLVEVDRDGRLRAEGAPAPSSNTAIHLAVYAAVAEAAAIVHAHPVHTTALSFGRDEIVARNVEGQIFLGRVPVVDAPLGEEAGPVAEALRASPIAVVRGHGSFARGTDVWDALRVISSLEEAAHILSLLER